jgi:hypothetical protein
MSDLAQINFARIEQVLEDRRSELDRRKYDHNISLEQRARDKLSLDHTEEAIGALGLLLDALPKLRHLEASAKYSSGETFVLAPRREPPEDDA